MEFEEVKDSTIMDTPNTDDGEKSSQGNDETTVHSLYLPKINRSFVDPSLKASLESAKQSLKRLTKEKSRLSTDIEFLQGKVKEVRTTMRNRLYSTVLYDVRNNRGRINALRNLLKQYWPESMNEDPEDVPDPEIEEAIYNKRTPELTAALSHRRNNLAEEKRMIKELDHLNRRKEKLDREVKEAEARIPKSASKRDSWDHGSKHDIFRDLRDAMKKLKELEMKEKVVEAPYEQKIAEYMKKIEALEKRYQRVEEQHKWVDANVLELQLKLEKLATPYNEYWNLIKKAKEFGKQGEFVALEELVRKGVEDFMSRWSSDEAFRANYIRSIQKSFPFLGLSSDGRMKDSTK